MSFERYLAALALCPVVFGCKGDKPPPPPPAAVAANAEAQKPEPSPTPPSPAPEPDEGPFAWVVHSGDGSATLRQKPAQSGFCFAECTLGDGKVAWSSAKTPCLAEKADWKFLAIDCQRTVVMVPSPPRDKSWRQTEVMRVYQQQKLKYPVMGIAALPDEKLFRSNPAWLKGTYGLPGQPPRYSSDSLAVEYDTIDGKSHSVPLKAD